MSFADKWGVPLATTSGVTSRLVDEATVELVLLGGLPSASLDAAIDADPDAPLPRIARAILDLFAQTSVGRASARARLEDVDEMMADAPERERRHLAAAHAWAAGRLDVAARHLERAVALDPHDLLAIRIAHDLAFFLGDTRNIRDVVARALYAWRPTDPLFGAVEGMYAFGLEENGDFRAAEAAARRALDSDERDVWAHHALAHVFEMEGRTAEGVAFLRESSTRWEESFFAVHNWWHLALFLIEQGDLEGALALYDGPVRRAQSPEWLDLVDAGALLWRLSLLGVDVRERARGLLGFVEPRIDDALSAFNDLHAVMICTLAEREDLAHAVVGASTRPRETSNGLALELSGRRLLGGFMRFGLGDAPRAVDDLWEARPRAGVIGGSIAQRDVIDQTLLAAAARTGDRGIVAALTSERQARKPSGAPAVARLVAANWH